MWILWCQIRPCGWKLSHISYAHSIFPVVVLLREKRVPLQAKAFQNLLIAEIAKIFSSSWTTWCWLMMHQKLKLLLHLLHWCCSSTNIPPNKIQHIQIFFLFWSQVLSFLLSNTICGLSFIQAVSSTFPASSIASSPHSGWHNPTYIWSFTSRS